MTVLDFITLTRRGWKVLVIAVLAGLLIGAAYGFLAPKVYVASATGFISASGSSVVAGSDEAVARAGAYVPLINSGPVHKAIAEETGLEQSALAGGLSARVVPGSTLIEVTASSSSPEAALNLANGALHGLVAVIDDIEAQAQNPDGTNISIVPLDNAVAPSEPSSPNLKLALALGALGGLVAGYAFLLLRRALDVRVRMHTDINALIGSGVLGRVPKLGRGGSAEGTSKNDAIAAEAFRQIRTGLRFSSVDGEVRVIMVTSANQSEGKSMVAASLARVMAEAGQRTIIIDGDLRRPKVARNFELDGSVGLSEVLSGQVPIQSAIQPTKDANLFVIASGGVPPNPSEMLGSTAMQRLLTELRRDFFVIVDAPPVLPVTDASVVGAIVDGVAFVVAVGKTRTAEAAGARQQLDQVQARILGVILNMVPLSGPESGYGYGYGYYRRNDSYYVQAAKTNKAKKAKKESAPHGRAGSPQPGPAPVTPVERQSPQAGERRSPQTRSTRRGVRE
ncbi:polysaccharide biosynthesis tyrosine autokinase [Microbacterium sp. SD291]|uniref:polysaccharide biosynthesis tyrosine autokinase n=1 Tax=Microbacterium sp. SD291 TaxID=2782007 RepID=UPI001A967B3C|nr:polysaccharide biosynthesis tyrosine autokinase [Microbacterium sp. SD291]MBO0981008.1 polysaccharide biosynthesis tyrosine autokinase [Microbacterium sp. SD291]